MAKQGMIHPERLPLGGSVTTGISPLLPHEPRRGRLLNPVLLVVVIAALLVGLTTLTQWLTGH